LSRIIQNTPHAHPSPVHIPSFEDGNGRLGRALADMALAQDMQAQDAQANPALVRV
jgi:hypothetical protein